MLFCGPEEERGDWDNVGTCLRHVMTSPHSGGHKRWSTPNIVLYGPVDMSNNICSSFGACRSLKIVRIEAADLLMQYNHVGVVAISDLFLRATCERPSLLFIERFDTVAQHPMINELCFQLDNLDSQVHAFVAVRLVLVPINQRANHCHGENSMSVTKYINIIHFANGGS